MFSSHDLEVVRHVSDRVIVMYHGAVMEDAPAVMRRASPLPEDPSFPAGAAHDAPQHRAACHFA
jgi:ABC-type multidrug transport system ATPase subunit